MVSSSQFEGSPLLVLEPHPNRPPPSPDGPCERRYVDDRGTPWCVHELIPDDGPPSLYFESCAAFRRVRHYPANWRQIGPEQLEALSHQT
jgi:hypothetical protein